MDESSIISLATNLMDALLIGAAVWMAIAVAKLRLGGALSSSVNRIVLGPVFWAWRMWWRPSPFSTAWMSTSMNSCTVELF